MSAHIKRMLLEKLIQNPDVAEALNNYADAMSYGNRNDIKLEAREAFKKAVAERQPNQKGGFSCFPEDLANLVAQMHGEGTLESFIEEAQQTGLSR